MNSWCDLAGVSRIHPTLRKYISGNCSGWQVMFKQQKTWWALLTCSSWHGRLRGWGLHTGSEQCCKNSLARRSPSLHLNIKWKNSGWNRAFQDGSYWDSLAYASDFTRLLVQCVSQKDKDNGKGDQSCPPSQQEHNDHATNCSQQRQPFIIQYKRRTPTWWHTHQYLSTPIKNTPFIWFMPSYLASW